MQTLHEELCLTRRGFYRGLFKAVGSVNSSSTVKRPQGSKYKKINKIKAKKGHGSNGRIFLRGVLIYKLNFFSSGLLFCASSTEYQIDRCSLISIV